MQRYFITTCASFRRPVFTAATLVTEVVDQLLDNAMKFEFAVFAYCVMPDHLHALIEATSEGSDLKAFMKRFKQMTGFSYRRATGQSLGQPEYHEHILRSDEATDAVARYILENPIRARLATALGEYPFAGSGVHELQDLMALWERQA